MLPAILALIFATTFLIASVAVTAGSFLLGGRLDPGKAPARSRASNRCCSGRTS
jgi:hypothetical protein